MAFDAQGRWQPEDDGVASRVAALTSGTSPTIQAARASGLQTANKRGLINSSMAAGASEGAAIGAALPIASQEAQQAASKNQLYQQGGQDMDRLNRQGILDMDRLNAQGKFDMDRQLAVTASNDRQAALGAQVKADENYLNAFGQIAGNKDIPAGPRADYLNTFSTIRNSAYDAIQQTYGIKLEWSGKPGGAPAPVPASPAPAPVPLTSSQAKANRKETDALVKARLKAGVTGSW